MNEFDRITLKLVSVLVIFTWLLATLLTGGTVWFAATAVHEPCWHNTAVLCGATLTVPLVWYAAWCMTKFVRCAVRELTESPPGPGRRDADNDRPAS